MYKYTTEQFISFLESNKIEYTIDRNPSKEKIDLILKQIEKTKQILNTKQTIIK
jgi:hypothetical protein